MRHTPDTIRDAANKDVVWEGEEGGKGRAGEGGGTRKEIDSLLALPEALCQVLARRRCRRGRMSPKDTRWVSVCRWVSVDVPVTVCFNRRPGKHEEDD